MKPPSRDTLARLYGVLYEDMCAAVDAEHSQLFSSLGRQTAVALKEWSNTWVNAFERRKALHLSTAGLLQCGRLLARVAESYSANEIADDIFGCFDVLARESDPNGLEVADVLVGAGELDRRAGHVERAVVRFQHALKLIESQDTAEAHKLASRTFYELAYIELYRGDAKRALEQLARSQSEAEISGDRVGAGIARALSAAVRTEEGIVQEPIEALGSEALNFATLGQSEELRRSGRHVFANRWRVNCEIHRMQALLAADEIEEARRAYDEYMRADPNPSKLGNIWIAFTGACILLAQGDLERAAALTKQCKAAMPQPFEAQESAASILSLYGVISLLRGDAGSAREAFSDATDLDPSLRNAKGQGWAALGLAIIALGSDDRGKAVEALDVGIERCARCCAPVRRALIEVRGNVTAGLLRSGEELKADLRALTGVLGRWGRRG